MFEDRAQAGTLLALKLKKIVKGKNFIIVSLLHGGIILGKEISDYFNLSQKPLAVKKIGAPFNPELAIGAVTSDKTSYFDRDLIKQLNIGKEYVEKSLQIKWKEAQALQDKFKTKISLKNKRIIIVDDGIATGTTAICASIYVKKQKAKEIILASPVIAKNSLKIINVHFDRIISLKIACNLNSVGQFYKFFPQINDEEAGDYLI
jgi:putative phosphoribosyl transferase